MNSVAGIDSRYKWRVLVVVMIGTMMAALDSSIVNVSIPAIMADFGASLDDIEWVVTGYMPGICGPDATHCMVQRASGP